MTSELATRVFAASEADEVAHLAVHHDPEMPRTLALLPEDGLAAEAGVLALAECLHGLPKSIQFAVNNATGSAGYLSDDRLQGLAELIQNAEDVGATEATITVDSEHSRLLFSHNGAGLTLHDVWALAIPWLSLKVGDAEQLGRFGIGLKTLHALSEVLEVHQGHFRVRFDAGTITFPSESVSWPSADTAPTTFAVPFKPGAITNDEARAWLTRWDDAGLIFLRNLSTVRLVDGAQNDLLRLRLDHGPEEPLELAHGPARRRPVSADDGRQWLVYSRRVPLPDVVGPSGKAQGEQTPLAFAFPLFEGDTGHIHVGLPVRPTGLPFRLLAHFDPQPSRRDIADTSDLNPALIPLLSDLWQDATLDIFKEKPSRGWAVIPLVSELDAGEPTGSRVRTQLDEHLMRRARTELAASLAFADSGASYPIHELAYEAPELTGILSPENLREVSGKPGSLTAAVRSTDDRWRRVLDDFHDLDVKVPVLVGVEDAAALLEDEGRAPDFIADLVAVTVETGHSAALESRASLVLDDGTRVSPSSRDGLDVLVPADRGTLGDLLNIGACLHPAFTDHPRWTAIRDWLRGEQALRMSASDADALRVLADAGDADVQLPQPLSAEQVDGIRCAFEAVADSERRNLGEGVGQAIEVDAVTFDAKGTRQRGHARPCDAYFVEREASSWWMACGKTPGLIWIDRRYSTRLKGGGSRDSIGAQRLFRLLGAEATPRIESHPANTRRFVYHGPGVPRWAKGSPKHRNALLDQHQATYTVEDWVSPDLDAVLADIATEKDAAQRRRRAGAVLATLTRAWERLRECATVMAAAENRGWVDKGNVEAWWICSAASITWLTSEKGRGVKPCELRLKSPATVALYGDDPERYLSPSLDVDTYREVLARIGVAGDPTVQELVQRLEDVRAETTAAPETAEDLAAPLYQALASQVGRGQKLGRLTASAARSAFSRGDGLIATRGGWRRPSVVFAGPPIFGDLRDFVPSVSGTEALWRLLAIQSPTYRDAREVLGTLARRRLLNADAKLVMLEALRVLVGAPADELAKLKRAAVWVGDRWERKRPVYATHNSLIAKALKGRVPVWEPGGALAQLDSLIEPYRLTRLDAPHGQVLDADDATYDADLTQVFSRAVANLRADLALSDPEAEECLQVSWSELAALSVVQLPGLRVRLVEPTYGLDETVELDTWLDPAAGRFYVVDDGAAGSPSSGAYAVASVFSGDSRRIAHDWVAAWSIALEGHRAEAVTTAARLDEERKKERDERSEERLRALAEQGKSRRTQKGAAGRESAGDGKGGKEQSHARKSKPTRHLVDPDDLALLNQEGEIVGGTSNGSTTPAKDPRGTSNAAPKHPDVRNPKKLSADGGRGVKNYTDEERESVGLVLVRRVLGGNEEQIVDIRHQRNVGADAIDELENFFELKVYAGPIPESVSLTSAEFRRAQETEQFFLVVVSNVERGVNDPEVRIITNPLDHLGVLPQGSVSLGGVRDAKSLRYKFEESDGDANE